MKHCIWPHHVEALHGVTPCSVEELPQTCTCGESITYSEDLVFVARPNYSPEDEPIDP